MTPLELLASATETFRVRLSCLTAEDLEGLSTCTEWTVRDISDHVVGGNRFAVATLAGEPLDSAVQSAMRGGFDGDPVDLFSVSATAQLRAFNSPEVLTNSVEHPMGAITGKEFLEFRICDLVLHSWDVARSTGGDERIADELVEFVLRQFADGKGRVLDSKSYDSPIHHGNESSITSWDEALLLSGRRP